MDPDAEAQFITASVLGLFVLIRAEAPAAALAGAARAAVAHLDGLRAAHTGD